MSNQQGIERNVLGCVFFNNKLGEILINELNRDHFIYYNELFGAMYELIIAEKPINYEFIKGKIDDKTINSVATSVWSDIEFYNYIKELKEMKYRKDMKSYITKLSVKANDYNISNDEIDSMLCNIPLKTDGKTETRSSESLINQYMKHIAIRRASEDDMEGLRTGYDKLDRLVGGMKPGETIGIKAESNVGKSLFTKDVAINVAMAGHRVDIFSYEMNSERTMGRILPEITNIPAKNFKFPKELWGNKEIKKMQEADMDFMENLTIYADELKNKTVEEISSMLNKTNIKKGNLPELIIIDYLQELNHNEKEDWKGEQVNNTKIQRIAKKYNCPVLIIVSMAKDGSIRGSGKILYAMDQVWELSREVDAEDETIACMTELKVAKSRASETGKIMLDFDKKYITFREM